MIMSGNILFISLKKIINIDVSLRRDEIIIQVKINGRALYLSQ